MESLGLGGGGKAMLLFGEAHHVQVRAVCMLPAVRACCVRRAWCLQRACCMHCVCCMQCACRLKRA